MTNNDLSKYIFCATRNVLWQLGYSCIYAFFSLIISALIAIIFGSVIHLIGSVPKDVAIGLSALAFYVIFVISVICFLYPMYKKSLHKVFFKPYKNFTLYPTIDKINFKIVIQYFMLSVLINLPAIVYNIINYRNIHQDDITIPDVTSLDLLMFAWSLFIVQFIATTIIVKKYAKFS